MWFKICFINWFGRREWIWTDVWQLLHIIDHVGSQWFPEYLSTTNLAYSVLFALVLESRFGKFALLDYNTKITIDISVFHNLQRLGKCEHLLCFYSFWCSLYFLWKHLFLVIHSICCFIICFHYLGYFNIGYGFSRARNKEFICFFDLLAWFECSFAKSISYVLILLKWRVI